MMIRQSPYRAQAQRFDVFFEEEYDAPLVPPEMVFDEGEDCVMEGAEVLVVRAVAGESAPPPRPEPIEVVIMAVGAGLFALLLLYTYLALLRG